MLRSLVTATCIVLVGFTFPQYHVRGVVYDADSGDGIPDVVVSVVGSDICSTTDSSGRYKITVPVPKSTLMYTAPDYDAFLVRVGKKMGINVVLVTDFIYVNDVAVGYGTQAANQITGAVATIGNSPQRSSYMISYTTRKGK